MNINSMRVQLVAARVMPFFFGLIFSFEINGTSTPIVFFPWHVTAALEKQNRFTRRRELVREGPAAGAAADDNDIVMVVYCHVFLRDSCFGCRLDVDDSAKDAPSSGVKLAG